LEDNPGITGEGDLLALGDPAVVDGDRGTIEAKACGEVRRLSCGADDKTDDTEAIRGEGVASKRIAFLVLVERASSEGEQYQRNYDFIGASVLLRLRN